MTTNSNDATQTGLSGGATLTPANSGGGTNTAFASVNGTFTVDPAVVLVPGSTRSYATAAATGAKAYLSLTSGGASNQERARAYFAYRTAEDPTASIQWMVLGSAGVNYVARDVGGVLHVQTAGGNLYTTSAMTDGHVYCMEMGITIAGSNATVNFALHDITAGTTPDTFTTGAANTGTVQPSSAWFGKASTAGNMSGFHIDGCAVDNSSAGLLGLEVLSNAPPTVDAGPDQAAVEPFAVVALAGSGADTDGAIVSYAWTQMAGPAVTLSSTSVAAPTFTAPVTITGTTLTFQLTVTDNGGATAIDTVNIVILPHTFWMKSATGTLVPIQATRKP